MRQVGGLDLTKAAAGAAFVVALVFVAYTLSLRTEVDSEAGPLPPEPPPVARPGPPPPVRPGMDSPGPADSEAVPRGEEAVGDFGSRQFRAERALYAARFALVWRTWDRADKGAIREFLGGCDTRFRNWEWGWLSTVVRDDAVEVRGNLDEWVYLTFSPDGTYLGHGRDVIDVAKGEAICRFEQAFSSPHAFSPDGTRLAVPGRNNVVNVLSAQWGRSLMSLKGHKSSARCVAWSPAGDLIASGGFDSRVILWRAADGTKLHELEGGEGCGKLLAFDPRGRFLASSDSAGTVRVWEAATGRLTAALDPGAKRRSHRWIGFSTDGARLGALASGGRSLYVWDVRTGRFLSERSGELQGASSTAVSPDLRLVAHDGYQDTVIVRDVASGRALQKFSGGGIDAASIAFDAQSKHVAACYRDGMVRVWNIEKGEAVLTGKGHEARAQALAFSPDGTLLASAASDRTVRIWRLAWEEPVTKIAHRPANHFAFDAAWSRLAVAGRRAKVGLWDVAAGNRTAVIDTSSRSVRAVAWGPEARTLACGGLDGKVRLLEFPSGRELWRAEHARQLHFVAFGSEGERLYSGCEGGAVKVTDVGSGREIAAFNVNREAVPCYAFSHDDALIAAGGYRGQISVFDARTGAVVAEWKGHAAKVTALAFSPRGRSLASVSDDQTTRLWDARSGREAFVLKGHTARVMSVAFSADGGRVASGGADGTVKLWDVWTGTELMQLDTGSLAVKGLAFCPGDRRLAVFRGSDVLIHDAGPRGARSDVPEAE